MASDGPACALSKDQRSKQAELRDPMKFQCRTEIPDFNDDFDDHIKSNAPDDIRPTQVTDAPSVRPLSLQGIQARRVNKPKCGYKERPASDGRSGSPISVFDICIPEPTIGVPSQLQEVCPPMG